MKLDPGTGVEGGVQIENQALNTLVNSVLRAGKTVARDKNAARDELGDAANVIRSYLEGMDIRSRQLDREEVLEMLFW